MTTFFQFTSEMRSIDDNDVCSDCQHCTYNPGELSGCHQGWPGVIATDGHSREGQIIACAAFTEWDDGIQNPTASQTTSLHHPAWGTW